jgi:hypothetical protein
MSRSLRLQFWVLSGIVLANFIAQVVYYLRLYYTPQRPFPQVRSALELGLVFALFASGVLLQARGRKTGYVLLSAFCALEFAFYLWTVIGSVALGYGLFFQLWNPDPVLRAVFAIGYLNLFAAGYFLVLLVSRRSEFLRVGHA